MNRKFPEPSFPGYYRLAIRAEVPRLLKQTCWYPTNKSDDFELDDCASGASALFVTTITMSAKNFDVEYVAELARIKLTPDEIKTFESQLG